MVNSLRIPLHSLALVGLCLLSGERSPVRANPPDTAGSVAPGSPTDTHGGFFSSLKQAFSQHSDRDVVYAHFDVGVAPDTHRFYCLMDPKTGKHEPNGVAGETFRRPDGMTGLKGPAISPVSCADAGQKGILVTSGYTVKANAAGTHASVASVPAAAPAAAPVAAAAVAPAAPVHPRGSDLRAEMEAANAAFLAAYNSQNGPAFKGMYTPDAMLLPSSTQPVVGADAIGAFWTDRIKDGKRKNPTLEIVSVWADGRYAYQIARYTVDVVNEKGETNQGAGSTVRIFEKQAGGKWLTKVHIFNSYQ
jgi:ketosteroid isomerase-like protein